MKGTYILFSGILFVFLAFQDVFGQDSLKINMLSFDQALEITSQNSHVKKQMYFLQEQRKEEARAMKNYYLPVIGISASWMVMSDDIHLDLTPVKDAITPLYGALGSYGVFSGVPNPDPSTNQVMPVLPDNLSTQAVRTQLTKGLQSIESANWDQTIQKQQFGMVDATFQWPLYAGGKIRAANAAAKIQQAGASWESSQKNGELFSELVERYYGLCLARQAVLVRTDVLSGMKQHLSDALKMEKQGFIPHADVLHAEVFNAQAERELSSAKRTSSILNEALINTLAVDSSFCIEPVSALFYLDSIEPESYFQSLALANNPLLMQVDVKKQLTEQNYKIQRSEFLPSVAVMGMYDIVNKDLSPYVPDWTIGLGLKWTLFDGTARFNKVRAASLQSRQVDEFSEKARTDISTAVDKLYQTVQMYREQIGELETAVNFAREYVRIREKAFHEDMTNATEVVDARLALAKVSVERLQAVYNYDNSLALLLRYSGVPDQFNNYRTRKDAKTETYRPVNAE